ncbi:30S ribosomal protein S9 [Pseudonocardia sp. S2-4]|uniref:Small ribosomal subunit protein uS9 n=1 Tax=Pseudonocardia humida TaxID=2800819 RepID=A0ABT0ZW87_9PSEU|nr:30S ribosomal protein S9 [Pseudonocardia humida]
MEEGQPVTTPEPEIEAVEEAAVDAEATEIADAADDAGVDIVEADADAEYQDDVEDADVTDVEDFEVDLSAPEVPAFADRPIQTVGRRKEAVVRVRLMPGSGQFRLNGKSLEQYFPNKLHQQLIREPLVTVEKTERFDIFANLHGGGTSGQAGALRLAIARALIEADSEDRPPLKKAGFLTRDPRVIERKKYGLKKARKAPQYSKR